MMAVTFDTLAYVRKLEKSGMSHAAAVAQAEALAEAMDASFATKADVESIRSEMKVGFSDLRSEFQVGIERAKTSLITWLVGLTVIATTAQIAAKMFMH